MRSSFAGWLAVGAGLVVALGFALPQQPAGDFKVGVQPDGRIVVPTNQVLKPTGRQVTFPGRPVDLAFADEGKTLVVKNMHNLIWIDVATAKVRQTLDLPNAPSGDFNPNALLKRPINPSGKGKHYPPGFSVVGLLVEGDTVLATDAESGVRVARKQPDGLFAWAPTIPLLPPQVGGAAFPAGIARASADDLWVAASRGNSVQRIDRRLGQAAQQLPVGVAPYMVLCPRPDVCYVSNWGGDPPRSFDPQALSSGTPVHIDPRSGIANHGSVTVLHRVAGQWGLRKSVTVGLHPSGMVASRTGLFVYVANANSDSVSVIDTRNDEVAEWIDCRPDARLPFGSGANALALSPDQTTLYVANGTNNCIAVVHLGVRASEVWGKRERSRVAGLIPTGWYPGAVRLSPDGKTLAVANVKGVGALSQPRPVAQGKNTHDWLGSVTIVDVPDAAQLAKYTEEVQANNRLGASLAGLEPLRSIVPPVPVPARHGEPSVFRHVIYVIKENRSYDQILGDVKEGNGDPNLVMFGEDVTPNTHALVRQFTLFDNFYCSGSLSATGHQWTNEAYVTDYLEKTFGDFTRSYPVDGDDPLAFASSGFLWDNALGHGKTFRNYGEFTKTTYAPANATWRDVYQDYLKGTKRVKIDVQPNVASMRPFTHPHYPGFPLTTPDVYRAKLFIDELKEFERKDNLPNLIYLFLPCDHSAGTQPGFPTPRAFLADNDLALGRVIEAVSKSKFWPRTCIFVVEDDPQFGLDHVDGHRTVALVISPYTKRKHVDSTNYNQTGMVKTIELILGLRPMNQLDLSATPMRNAFQDDPDLTPYTAVPNRVPLDELNPPLEKLSGNARYWAQKSMELNFDKEDEADEDTLNRILWHATRGYDTPYPK